jgi:hypothetical protein
VRKETTMKTLGTLIPRLALLLRSVGPYAAIEFLLPGGSLVVLLYWWHRHRARRTRDVSNGSTALNPAKQEAAAGEERYPMTDMSSQMQRATEQPSWNLANDPLERVILLTVASWRASVHRTRVS